MGLTTPSLGLLSLPSSTLYVLLVHREAQSMHLAECQWREWGGSYLEVVSVNLSVDLLFYSGGQTSNKETSPLNSPKDLKHNNLRSFYP